MYAIIETGGKQYRVQPDDVIEIEKLDYNQGDNFNFDSVLAVSNDNEFIIGTPYVENAVVSAELIENGKDNKIIVYKYKPKKKYRRKQGHRQPFSRVKINEILLNTEPTQELQEETIDETVEETPNVTNENAIEENVPEIEVSESETVTE